MNDEPMWKRHLKAHSRPRLDALTPDAERDLEALEAGCGGNMSDFHYAIDTLTNAYGLNIVRPIDRAKPEEQKPRVDAQGQPLPNPWDKRTWNERDQRAIMATDPERGDYLKNMAQRPYEFQQELEEKEKARLRWNECNEKYDHTQNVLAHGNATARAEFIRKIEKDGTPEKLEIFERETKPVSIGLFGPVMAQIRAQKRTIQHLIEKDGDARLARIIRAAHLWRKAQDAAEHQKQQQQRREDALAAHRQRQAMIDARHNVTRYPDGRIVTGGT